MAKKKIEDYEAMVSVGITKEFLNALDTVLQEYRGHDLDPRLDLLRKSGYDKLADELLAAVCLLSTFHLNVTQSMHQQAWMRAQRELADDLFA